MFVWLSFYLTERPIQIQELLMALLHFISRARKIELRWSNCCWSTRHQLRPQPRYLWFSISLAKNVQTFFSSITNKWFIILLFFFQSGLTPLHVASFMGCMNIVIYLIQHQASPDEATVRGETPLHLAARANQTDIIRILLRNGAKVDARARVREWYYFHIKSTYFYRTMIRKTFKIKTNTSL